jgi:hypothetical protein
MVGGQPELRGENNMAFIDLGDCDWYAIDAVGQVALFTSAGSPHVPEFYWDRLELMATLSATVRRLNENVEIAWVRPFPPGTDRSSWVDVARRGVYGYDYDDSRDTGYLLCSVPAVPLMAADLGWRTRLPVLHGVCGQASNPIPVDGLRGWHPVPG